jgi:hypothetical protein
VLAAPRRGPQRGVGLASEAPREPTAMTTKTASETEADVGRLLIAYSGARALVRDPPPSIALPRRFRRAYLLLRPTWFAERWLARDLRRRLAVLDRGIAERLALGGDPTPDEVRDREALKHFQDSLLPRLSPVVTVALFAIAIVLAQTVTNALLNFIYYAAGSRLPDALSNLGLSPDASALGALVRALGDADLELLFAFVMGLLASGYILGRIPATGYRLARLALGDPDGLGLPRSGSDLARAVKALRIRETEHAVFAAIDRPRPHEFPVDLAVKALIALGWLYVAVFSLRGNVVDTDDYWKVYLLGGLASLRLLWLARAAAARGAGVAWLAAPVVVLIAGTILAEPFNLSETPSGANDPALALTLSLQPDLTGVDLRDRDLTGVYLAGKTLTRARLQDATLVEAGLSGARMRGAIADGAQFDNADLAHADLSGASLFGANLENANLTGAKLIGADLGEAVIEGAQLCAADLRGANGYNMHGRPYSDAKTRWPTNYTPPGPPDDAFDPCTD